MQQLQKKEVSKHNFSITQWEHGKDKSLCIECVSSKKRRRKCEGCSENVDTDKFSTTLRKHGKESLCTTCVSIKLEQQQELEQNQRRYKIE